ncbi:MAG: DUF892 family protein [Ignavibacteria bacterium]
MSKMKTMEDFLMDELKDIYSSEDQLITALPKIAKAAASADLIQAFENHVKETECKVERLNKISKLAGNRELTGRICLAMEGLIKEGSQIAEENCTPEVRDVALIAFAQKVEHHEIAAYGCAKTYARLLGYTEVEELLQESEKEEITSDKRLVALAKATNANAMETREASV